jgi:hypothetical protein
MLFVITHEHAPELCPADDPTQVHKLTDENHIKESGVKVVGSYIASLEHTMYFVLEADDYGQVVRYLRPIMKIGTPDVVPAQTLAKGLGPFFKG